MSVTALCVCVVLIGADVMHTSTFELVTEKRPKTKQEVGNVELAQNVEESFLEYGFRLKGHFPQ